ncbi:MAG: phosphodiester glycosidase family protein [Bacillota bacterium]
MKYIRKTMSAVLIISILLVFSFTGVNAGTIHETSSFEIITSGVVLEKITRFTDEGWLKINVLRVNLDNPNVKVDTISNTESISKLTNTKTLAQSNGAIAAVNASFFNWMSEPGKAYPDGPVVQSGQIISADSEYNKYNDSMATFSMNNLNEVFYDYWKTSMVITAPTGSSGAVVRQYNKPSSNKFEDIAVWSRKWSKMSPGVSSDCPDIVEMVVDWGIVKEIRKALPSVEIPENGYVVIARGVNGQFLEQNFRVGDTVNFSISTTPDWGTIEMAVTGSAILVKDGKIPAKFSYVHSGRPARTAVGSSRTGKQLILATVDGPKVGSLGMTQTELAQLMISLGAYNAVNLDGGGSTTMVARKPGTNDIQIVNAPSDGAPRAVANAIGIFSICPPSSLEGLIIDTADTNVFVNTSREFTVRGYDTYFNPLTIDESQVKWSVTGIKGTFRGNVFYPETEGEGTVTASIGNITSSINVRVLGSPSQLTLSEKSLYLNMDKSKTLSIIGRDKSGYSAYINPLDVNWSLSGDIGKLDKNKFTAVKNGTGYISASLGSTHAYCAVSVASETMEIKDSFEAPNGSFLSAPSTVPGSYEISSEQKTAGNSSGKLTYDFSNLEGTRAAYLVFANEGISLSSNTTKIGLWVYNPHENTNWLRAEVYDSSGKKHLVDFTRDMYWTGWKRVEASLADIKSPSKLTKIYIAQVNPVADFGSIYFDDLDVKTATYPTIEAGKIPQDTIPSDEANKQVDFKDESNSHKFTVFSGKTQPENLLEKLLVSELSEKTAADTNLVNTQIITGEAVYKSYDIENSRIIQLNTTKAGIRESAAGQWQWFLDKLTSFEGDNIFIFMKDSPGSFSDKMEADLFKKVIVDWRKKTGKNIWVFYKGSVDKSYMADGIKYISTAGLNAKALNPVNALEVKYIEITVMGNSVTYQVKSVVE